MEKKKYILPMRQIVKNGFSFPKNSEAYLALALTESEIEELKNPTQEELPV